MANAIEGLEAQEKKIVGMFLQKLAEALNAERKMQILREAFEEEFKVKPSEVNIDEAKRVIVSEEEEHKKFFEMLYPSVYTEGVRVELRTMIVSETAYNYVKSRGGEGKWMVQCTSLPAVLRKVVKKDGYYIEHEVTIDFVRPYEDDC